MKTYAGTGVAFGLTSGLAESFVDNVLRDKVQPVPGSLVYCDLALAFEHSGIYVGNDQIVHLNGDGRVEAVSPARFLQRLGGFNPAISIYVSCRDKQAVGSPAAAARAMQEIGKRQDYNVLFDNCHQFSSWCLSDNRANSDSFTWMLKDTAKAHLHANTWRVWDWED
ncbi:lecithin retinol acyltransferase family protein [Salinivibrio sp. HTSP]|uniref:lecithin retinol acyltransferase family protein n=1 Tax=Salinivibrio sp. HTSP TaxID=2115977 RepID=UPI000E32178D|nr:lecithin retinol acyltransferase family protein [Salinivibrio sp. HTSP]